MHLKNLCPKPIRVLGLGLEKDSLQKLAALAPVIELHVVDKNPAASLKDFGFASLKIHEAFAGDGQEETIFTHAQSDYDGKYPVDPQFSAYIQRFRPLTKSERRETIKSTTWVEFARSSPDFIRLNLQGGELDFFKNWPGPWPALLSVELLNDNLYHFPTHPWESIGRVLKLGYSPLDISNSHWRFDALKQGRWGKGVLGYSNMLFWREEALREYPGSQFGTLLLLLAFEKYSFVKYLLETRDLDLTPDQRRHLERTSTPGTWANLRWMLSRWKKNSKHHFVDEVYHRPWK
jgi:hypothetical protein